MKTALVCALCVAVLLVATVRAADEEKAKRRGKKNYRSRPNVIIFLVDDLGYGDLDHPTTNTPHISKLAREGLVFTQFYTTSPVSSPARASLLTGRYHMRTGVYPGGFAPNDVGGLPYEETTIAEGLKEIGYSTGMVGKWHLGVGKNGMYLPHRHGFDYYLGIPYAHDNCPCHICYYPDQLCEHTCNPQYVPCPLVEIKNNRKKILQQPVDLTNLTVAMAEAAVNFIDESSEERSPFFLYYSFHHVHYPHFSGEQFRNSSVRGTFGDALREVDWSVGQVMKAVRLNGLNKKTFVFFTSDNGPDLSSKYRDRDREGSAGILRCGKGSTWEGGMRVPAIAWWQRMVLKGFTHQLASTIDILPTVFQIAGVESAENVTLDGYEMTNLLYYRGGMNKRKNFLYFPEMTNQTDGAFAMQWRGFKAHFKTGGGDAMDDYYDPACRRNATLDDHYPPLLYSIYNDPRESYKLDPYKYANVVRRMEMMKNDYLYSLEWAEPETLRGQDDNVQLCARPNCSPFPYCCRTEGGEYEMDEL